MIILVIAIVLLGLVTYYFHLRDQKKQLPRKSAADSTSCANATACWQA